MICRLPLHSLWCVAGSDGGDALPCVDVRMRPFSQADLRNAIPAKCWEKNTFRSMAHLFLDVGIVAGLAIGAATLNAW